MTRLLFFICVLFILSASAKAQQSIKLDYFLKVPANYKDCGILYTYDTVGLEKKKYILLTDYQNLGLMTIAGKQIKLQLTDTKTVKQTSIMTYKGASYTVIVTSATTGHKGKLDVETGTLLVINGTKKQTIKIHGLSGCDESKQEGNL